MNKSFLSAMVFCSCLSACAVSETGVVADGSRKPESAAAATMSAPAPAVKDVVYKTVNGQSLKLDLYRPSAQTRNAPLVVWIHGGAWKRGAKEDISRNSRLLNSLLADGYAVAAVGYRLSAEAVFPAQIQDINDAAEYLWRNSTQYGIDKNRIAMAGRSAGAHLAALATTANTATPPSFITSAAAPDFKVGAMVGFFGPYDLIALSNGKNRNNSGQSPEGLLLGGAPHTRAAVARQASPVSHVGPGTPPVLLLHGTNDKNVPHAQSEAFKARLDAAGIANELYLAQGARHGDPVFDNEFYVGKVMAFLRKYFPARQTENTQTNI